MSKTRGSKPLLLILLASAIGIVLTVLGGLIAQERNINQYAARQVDHQIEWITNHPEAYDPASETTLADWVANKIGRTGLSRTDIIFAVNSAGEDVTKLGAQVPDLAQSGLLQDVEARAQILAVGEGRVGSAVGDFYHRTVNLNVGNETVTLASLVYLGGLEEVQNQTRNSMVLLGLGGFLILAIVAANLLLGKKVVDADRSPHSEEHSGGTATASTVEVHSRGGDGPRRISVTSSMGDHAEYERERNMPPAVEPNDVVAPTQRQDAVEGNDDADGECDSASVPESGSEHSSRNREIRASGVWSWSEEDGR
ncbi:hypothetical protein J2S70_000789 [Trueperella bonasi]|uniref:Uncharacterized protein n=1 Tax=Trueperella bonasi TaxID=312286 RepID=A0ABT9NFN6_9ACTO|nr:hypothetical protein [Trueperella bonasi]MDP9806207.1 hypothetical protein [Trueperella bonasi]